jgi:hypothetical protein
MPRAEEVWMGAVANSDMRRNNSDGFGLFRQSCRFRNEMKMIKESISTNIFDNSDKFWLEVCVQGQNGYDREPENGESNQYA